MINTSLFALFGRYKGDASLAGVLENIQRGTYKQFIDETREALASGDKELAAKLKKKLPAFTPQATYSGKRLDPHITRYNQLGHKTIPQYCALMRYSINIRSW